MKAELLRQLVEDRRNERAVVLATNLDTGDQTLLYPLEAAPNPQTTFSRRPAPRS